MIDIEVESGFGIGADVTAYMDGIKLSGSAEIAHKKVYNEHGFKEEIEEAKITVNLSDEIKTVLGSQATAESNWNYDNIEFTVTVFENDIVAINSTDSQTTVEIKDQTIEFGLAGYLGIGGGAKIIINISELGRIIGILPEKQEYQICN